ncbi:sugar ABC transporter permease [Treponema socranskii]|uniref:carbohydrate ABC transporter permease n=1 Tax=Treponema TaxID=157 RepID=UPI0016526B8A|nr:sugar ABC transporter permease [Treponema sp. Marseille-Q4130]MBC6718974.1 sugar ABC transporter permease [Treponema sp. Marseille-Q4130]
MKFADKKKNALLYASFVGPSVLFFILVFIVPLLYGFYLTLTDWDGIASSIGFTGFSNYVEVFTDLSFWQSMRRTILYSAASVIAINVIAFLLAYLLTGGVKAESFLRAGFFTPNLIGGLILGYIWQFVFSRVFVNIYKIIPVALFEKSWLSSPGTAMASLIIVATWQYSGYMLLIYIAGFVGIPHDLIEAARIDGAGEGLITRKIRIPLMVPSIVISLFLSITRTFKVYDVNLSLTAGGPYDSTKLAAMHIYSKAFEEQRYGVGQAEALVMFVCMAAIALTQTYIGKKRELEM